MQTPEQGSGAGTIDAVAGSGAALYPELVGTASCHEVLAPVSR